MKYPNHVDRLTTYDAMKNLRLMRTTKDSNFTRPTLVHFFPRFSDSRKEQQLIGMPIYALYSTNTIP